MCCNVLQCVAMCCNVLQCVAMCCNVLQCVAALTMNVSRRITRMTRRVPRGMCHSLYRNESVHLEVCCSVLQPYATTLPMKRFWSLGTGFKCSCHCSGVSVLLLLQCVLQSVAVRCSVMQSVVVWCSLVQSLVLTSLLGRKRLPVVAVCVAAWVAVCCSMSQFVALIWPAHVMERHAVPTVYTRVAEWLGPKRDKGLLPAGWNPSASQCNIHHVFLSPEASLCGSICPVHIVQES